MISDKTFLIKISECSYIYVVSIVILILCITYYMTRPVKKTIEVMYFYTDWCLYCKNFNPEWNKFKQLCDNVNNLYNIQYIEIDEDMCNTKYLEYKITEFPTILIKYDNEVTEYNEVRTGENIHKYILRNIK